MADQTNILNEDTDDPLSRFKQAIARDANSVGIQRDRANEDMRFLHVAGGQWEGFLDAETQKRIRLELDMVSSYNDRLFGEWSLNRTGVEFKPDDFQTSDDDAELLNGAYRFDFRRYRGKQATDNAVLEAISCGFGAFKLASEFDDKGDPENDLQHLEHRTIFNAYNTVYFDNAAQEIDKSDARHCTTLKQHTRRSFLDQYPDMDPVPAYAPVDRAFENHNIVALDPIYVATRYEIATRRTRVFVYRNLAEGTTDTFTAAQHTDQVKAELNANPAVQFVRDRMIEEQFVEKTVFSGADILEPTRRIAGQWIPVIPVYFYRAYVDGTEWYHGSVRKLKDAQRLFNMQASQICEDSASGNGRRPIFDPEQMEGPDIEAIWANKTNAAYLLARALRDTNGNIIQTGPIAYDESAALDPNSAALLEAVPQFLQGVTGGLPQDTLDPDASGKAINAMIKRANMNSQRGMDSIDQAIAWAGTVYQSMAKDIYSEDRILRVLSLDGTEGKRQVNQLRLNEKTGQQERVNTIRGKKFHVYADSGPQYETMSEQNVEDIKGMLPIIADMEAAQAYMPILVSMLIDNNTSPGLKPLREFNRKQMLMQGIVEPETDEEKQFMAKVQQQREEAAQQPDPQEELMQAVTGQQQAEARNLDTDSIGNIAQAEKDRAAAQKMLADAEQSLAKARQIQQEAGLAADMHQVDKGVKLAEVALEAQKLPFENNDD